MVAQLAVSREPEVAVVRIRRRVVVRDVARRTVTRQPVIHIAAMARIAVVPRVSVRKRERGGVRVVRGVPPCRVMARLTHRVEPSRSMPRIGRRRVIIIVTRIALRRQTGVHPSHVAISAIEPRVPIGQRE